MQGGERGGGIFQAALDKITGMPGSSPPPAQRGQRKLRAAGASPALRSATTARGRAKSPEGREASVERNRRRQRKEVRLPC